MAKAFFLVPSSDGDAKSDALGEECPAETLEALGVFTQHFEPSLIMAKQYKVAIAAEAEEANLSIASEGAFEELLASRGYTYRDTISSTKIPDLAGKLAMFFEEHMHDDEEIRFFLEGSGFFDVRDQRAGADLWVRVVCGAGDLVVLPAGIYHRFNPDEHMFFHVLRLFKGEPIWTPHNRENTETEHRPARKAYRDEFLI